MTLGDLLPEASLDPGFAHTAVTGVTSDSRKVKRGFLFVAIAGSRADGAAYAADAARRGLTRTVVVAHAFVTGGSGCESERDIRVGGIGDVPADVFRGFDYVALGHLHGRQHPVAGSARLAYSGSPLAFSFSERHHTKSVELVDLDGDGTVTSRSLLVPVPRPLREVRGRLADLLERAASDLAGCRDAWVRAVITDPSRPHAPLEQLRAVWPHTLLLAFEPEGGLSDPAADLARLATLTDPVDICAEFVRFVDGEEADDEVLAVLRASVEAVHARDPGPAGEAEVA